MLGASSLGTIFLLLDPEDVLKLQATRCENPRSRGEDSSDLFTSTTKR